MNDATDQQLLCEYARHHTQSAFDELVRRHVDLVYAASRRLVADPHWAEDVTQSVFLALARQAKEVAQKLVAGAPLSGWLHVTTRNLAAATVRAEERRRAREQESALMRETTHTESSWEQIAPHLDAALAALPEADRDALLLRFFERKTAREIGERFGLSQDAAQKRISRALDRLRDIFVARGLAVPSTSLGSLLTVNAIQSAPTTLTSAVSAAVAAALGASPISTLGILQLMASTKLKLGVAALVVAGAATSLVWQQREIERLKTQLAEAQAQPEPAPEDASAPAEPALEPRQLEELLRLRGEVAQLRAQSAELRRLQAERLLSPDAGAAGSETDEPEDEAMDELKRAGLARLHYTKQWGVAFWKFAEANEGMLPANIDDAAPYFEGGEDTGDLRPDHYELVYQGSLRAIENPAKTIILREREAFPHPRRDGFYRSYLFADGHSEIIRREDGNFESWERERLAPHQGSAP